jgi:hypothetical protein
MQSSTRTWHSCFQCLYSHVDRDECEHLAPEQRSAFERCSSERGFNMVDVSNYAAQIGWWLNFFPPERFLVISSLELRSEHGRIKVCCAATHPPGSMVVDGGSRLLLHVPNSRDS